MPDQFPRVSLYHTQERRIFCQHVQREYRLDVVLPNGYDTSTQAYPVVYVLDGDVNTGMAHSATAVLGMSFGTPDIIVVGISYDLERMEQWGELREVDFKVPEVKDAPANSHAELFLKALTGEIVPFIEAHYRAHRDQRILYGYSSSGFFALYALLHEPDAFRTYLAGSPDLYISCDYWQAHDQTLKLRPATPPIQLYMSIGDHEFEGSWMPFYHELVNVINTRRYPGVSLISDIYAGEEHGPLGAAMTYIRGLVQTLPANK